VLVQEQMGRVTNALGWVAATPPAWLPPVATVAQLDRYVRPAIQGEREECYAITEEGAGSDVSAIEASARRDRDGYVLNGVKWHVTSYNTADYAFFQAKLAGGPHDGEHAMFIVDLPSPGVRVVRTPAYTHTISHHHPIVAFEDVRVPLDSLVGAEGDGMGFAYEWFRFERLMVAARCLGGAERLTAEMTAFAAGRQAGGHPISEYGLVAGMLADSQVFGGRGYMRENVAERFYRELRVERIWEGTSEVQRAIITGQMLKRGPATLA
jgi:acyl-CoA dehydrogenase